MQCTSGVKKVKQVMKTTCRIFCLRVVHARVPDAPLVGLVRAKRVVFLGQHACMRTFRLTLESCGALLVCTPPKTGERVVWGLAGVHSAKDRESGSCVSGNMPACARSYVTYAQACAWRETAVVAGRV